MEMRRPLTAILTALTLATLAGCASLPSPDLMKAETATFQLPKLPDPGKAMVYVVRPTALGGVIRFNVFVDDQEAASEMGFTRGNQYIYFHVNPGTRKIFSKAENWAEAEITVKAGDIVYIQQFPTMGFIMARNDIQKVEEYQGKYHVKTLSIGTIHKIDK
jgi:hypothetical protein